MIHCICIHTVAIYIYRVNRYKNAIYIYRVNRYKNPIFDHFFKFEMKMKAKKKQAQNVEKVYTINDTIVPSFVIFGV